MPPGFVKRWTPHPRGRPCVRLKWCRRLADGRSGRSDIETADTEHRASYPPDVHVLEVDGREFVLVGTAHISQESADLVREVIEKERPDSVCIELDAGRYEALSQKRRFEELDLREVIRRQQLSTLMLNLLLSAYQKQLGLQLGVMPGTELLEAAGVAQELGIPVSLCDRDVRVTLRRAWRSMSFWKKFVLLSGLMGSVFERQELTEDDLRELRQQDVLTRLMEELGAQFPTLKRVLIDERDAYLSTRIRQSAGDRVVAVVGAGHVAGIREALLGSQDHDLGALEAIPAARRLWKFVGWAIPAVILGSLAFIGWRQGAAAAGENALFWFLANAIPAGLGTAIALGHPATIAAAFFAAPFTSLTPVIGAGYVAAGVQTYFQPPLVKELQNVSVDAMAPRRWWSNRLLRIFLVFLFSTLGSAIGTWVGGAEILSNLF